MGNKYLVIECDICGVFSSKNLFCPVCKKLCKKIEIRPKIKEPIAEVINDCTVKRDDLGKLILTKNNNSKLYNIEFSNSEIMGCYDVTFEELLNLRRQITREKKRRNK